MDSLSSIIESIRKSMRTPIQNSNTSIQTSNKSCCLQRPPPLNIADIVPKSFSNHLNQPISSSIIELSNISISNPVLNNSVLNNSVLNNIDDSVHNIEINKKNDTNNNDENQKSNLMDIINSISSITDMTIKKEIYDLSPKIFSTIPENEQPIIHSNITNLSMNSVINSTVSTIIQSAVEKIVGETIISETIVSETIVDEMIVDETYEQDKLNQIPYSGNFDDIQKINEKIENRTKPIETYYSLFTVSNLYNVLINLFDSYWTYENFEKHWKATIGTYLFFHEGKIVGIYDIIDNKYKNIYIQIL